MALARYPNLLKSFLTSQVQLEVNSSEVEVAKFCLNFSQYNFEKLIQTLLTILKKLGLKLG